VQRAHGLVSHHCCCRDLFHSITSPAVTNLTLNAQANSPSLSTPSRPTSSRGTPPLFSSRPSHLRATLQLAAACFVFGPAARVDVPHLVPLDRFDEERKHWGGGLLGLKSQVCDDDDVDDDGYARGVGDASAFDVKWPPLRGCVVLLIQAFVLCVIYWIFVSFLSTVSCFLCAVMIMIIASTICHVVVFHPRQIVALSIFCCCV
jgi:hypothetical protein